MNTICRVDNQVSIVMRPAANEVWVTPGPAAGERADQFFAVAVPEPNTWRELLRALDERIDSLPLRGQRIAVQEYGESNAELLAGLSSVGNPFYTPRSP